ncbi:DUF3298 and DUF4163 domain-containing protein [Cytobacillus depressus]|uniref:DUF3298 and DUF4163 domain-containing protein n=1 Tax=Cytobacillus depressus TaxID=1602942 RepID=A0A6L3V1Z3_9BACI|nr:DUF3298 and DUF4163 domain-containing protein [Cytobacillus depressus]KAB2329953.1 DUF3298 and DUF4163 domain-containing protein [Cytobacillus depressus]
MDKKLEQLKEEYKNVPIPKELDEIIMKALPQKKKKKHLYIWPAGAAAAAMLLTVMVNFSPSAAHAMSKVPFMKGIVEVITFNEFKEEKNNTSISVKTPAISGLENKTLEGSLNEKYLEESKKLYEEFTAANKNGHLAIDSDFEVVTDTPHLLSIRRSIETIQASGYVQNRYVTIDKENQSLITLKSLFKDDQYVKVISENIKEQMKQQMKADPNKIYFLTDEDVEPFTQIDPNQQFYISDDHILVISFDEYEVAPGYMGAVEFKIPTEVISDILAGDRYIH